jgi:hypothetical protein
MREVKKTNNLFSTSSNFSKLDLIDLVARDMALS